MTEEELEKYKAELQTRIEVYKMANLTGHQAVRSLFVMNGGASIAMAAFIGSAAQAKSEYALDLQALATALLVFMLGVFFAATCMGLRYITSFFYAHNGNEKLEKWGHGFNVATVIIAIIGFICFAVGLYFAWKAF